jgi:chromosome partitioning protein
VSPSRSGLSTLLIDADPQGNLCEAFGVEPEHPGPRLHHALADPPGTNAVPPWSTRPVSDGESLPLPGGVHLLPGGDALEAAVSARTAEPAFALRLAELVDALRPVYDVVLIDTPPGLGALSSMAMLAADWVIASARPAGFDVGGAVKLAELIEHRLRLTRPELRLLGVLVTQVDQR